MTETGKKPQSLRYRVAKWIAWNLARVDLSSVTAQVDDSAGWYHFIGGPNDRDASAIAKQYTDALEAWRKNPMAKRVIDIIADYILGDGMTPTATGRLGTFISRWWHHPKNLMDLRLPELVEELARAGDIFVTFHRNPEDGLSYVRPIPKDRIQRIETLANDWETEIAYYETQEVGEPRQWLSPNHPNAATADAVMVHYAVNRVVGALMGESDLATIIPWLLRYSRLIEDRVRAHWAARAFLWVVTVPAAKVAAKVEQYRSAPDSGSVIVKEDSEDWQAISPDLKGFDAQFDFRAVRQMIDAGSGLPPHWRGEAHDVSLATAEAMEHAASRHLRRRQLFVRHMVLDMTYTAAIRAAQIRKLFTTPKRDAIQVEMTDIDREDNRDLAQAAQNLAQGMQVLTAVLNEEQGSVSLRRRITRLVMRFAGEPLSEPDLDQIFDELDQDSAETQQAHALRRLLGEPADD
jgi:hypothetical protein